MKSLKTIKYVIIAAGITASAAFYIFSGAGPGTRLYEERLTDDAGRPPDPEAVQTAAGETKAQDQTIATDDRKAPEAVTEDAAEDASFSAEQLAQIETLVRTALREELSNLAEEGYLASAMQEAEAYAAAQAEAHRGMINLNTASREELMRLPGIGEKKAEDIVSYREAHGPFAAIEEICRVSGIKEAAFAKIRDLIYV